MQGKSCGELDRSEGSIRFQVPKPFQRFFRASSCRKGVTMSSSPAQITPELAQTILGLQASGQLDQLLQAAGQMRGLEEPTGSMHDSYKRQPCPLTV